MAAAQSPPTGDHPRILALKSGRRPLQPKPKNLPHISATNVKPKLKPVEWTADSSNSNKENVHRFFNLPTAQQLEKGTLPMESLVASLADELMVIREKLERQRIDREKTDRALNERALLLDLQMKEILRRGEIQKFQEMEVDRLYRLKEMKLACLRVTPRRSLRHKEEEKKMSSSSRSSGREAKMKLTWRALLQNSDDGIPATVM